MAELLTAAQMSLIEKAAIDSGRVTGLELMERAGRGVADAIFEWRPELGAAPLRAVVLCGPGNNGGDGFVVARLLKERGWDLEIFLYGDEARLPPDAAENAQRWGRIGKVHLLEADTGRRALGSSGGTLVVDALFGSGLGRPLEGLPAELAEERWGPTVAIDAPSGLCMDSGRPLGPAFKADLTVTFHRARPGHYLAEGPAKCGVVALVDIGLVEAPADLRLLEGSPGSFLGKRSLGGQHKYDYGHALICSGGVGTGGAARLAARGALRVGAGAVTVAAPPAALIENAAQLNAIMLRPMRSLEALLEEPAAGKMNAICLGPGMGIGEATRQAVAAACRSGLRVVLDADALTSFEEDPELLFDLLHQNCLLTPHMGEFGRVFPDIAEKLAAPPERGPAYSKVDATREAAGRAGCAVLLKGPDTVIADPDGQAAINSAVYDRAAPWLATAGAGDVLAGFATGLLARDVPPMSAACAAAWLHVEAARDFGPGLIAEDLPEALPAVFRKLDL